MMIRIITQRKTLLQAITELSDSTVIACDTEFTKDGRLVTVQFGHNKVQNVLFYNEQEHKDLIQDLFLSEKIKIFHNAKADIKILWQCGIAIRNVYCTMTAEMLLNAGKQTVKGFYSLDAVTLRYCTLQRTQKKESQLKIFEEGFTPHDEELILYSAEDVKYLDYIYAEQMQKMRSLDMVKDDPLDLDTVCGLEMRALFPFAMIEYNGMKLDTQKWFKIAGEITKELLEIRKELNTFVDEPVNWNSWQQKLPVLQKIDPTVLNTQEATLLKREHVHPIFKLLIRYSKLNKLKTAFADKLPKLLNEHGRVCPSIWQVLATGRISMSNPNLQQIPSRSNIGTLMRKCFVPEEGWKIVGGDYSQAELRIIAHLSQDKEWLRIFREGKDLHTELCKLTFGITDKEVRMPTHFNDSITYRQLQKNLNFGLAYGVGPGKIAKMINGTTKQGKDIIKMYFDICPDVEKFLNNAAMIAKVRRYSETPFYNRKRFYGEGSVSSGVLASIGRQGKNHIIQGSNADFTKLALVYIYEDITYGEFKNDVIITSQVHDEIITEVRQGRAQDWAIRMQELMENAASKIITTLPIPADCQVSEYWLK